MHQKYHSQTKNVSTPDLGGFFFLRFLGSKKIGCYELPPKILAKSLKQRNEIPIIARSRTFQRVVFHSGNYYQRCCYLRTKSFQDKIKMKPLLYLQCIYVSFWKNNFCLLLRPPFYQAKKVDCVTCCCFFRLVAKTRLLLKVELLWAKPSSSNQLFIYSHRLHCCFRFLSNQYDGKCRFVAAGSASRCFFFRFWTRLSGVSISFQITRTRTNNHKALWLTWWEP